MVRSVEGLNADIVVCSVTEQGVLEANSFVDSGQCAHVSDHIVPVMRWMVLVDGRGEILSDAIS